MELTPQEFVAVQAEAATRAIETLTHIKGLAPIECGVAANVWVDPDGVQRARIHLNLAGHESKLDLGCDMMAIRIDASAEYSRICAQVREHIEKEVERTFGAFFDQLIRAFCKRRAC